MSDFKSRLTDERNELSIKHDALHAFLQSGKGEDIDFEQLVLLRIQIDLMHAYLQVLNSRLRLL